MLFRQSLRICYNRIGILKIMSAKLGRGSFKKGVYIYSKY